MTSVRRRTGAKELTAGCRFPCEAEASTSADRRGVAALPLLVRSGSWLASRASGLCCSRDRHDAVLAHIVPEDGRGRPEALERAVDAEEELPCRLWDRGDPLQGAQCVTRVVAGEQDRGPGQDDQRAADKGKPACRPRDQL